MMVAFPFFSHAQFCCTTAKMDGSVRAFATGVDFSFGSSHRARDTAPETRPRQHPRHSPVPPRVPPTMASACAPGARLATSP
jgi:hypothetical protein